MLKRKFWQVKISIPSTIGIETFPLKLALPKIKRAQVIRDSIESMFREQKYQIKAQIEWKHEFVIY